MATAWEDPVIFVSKLVGHFILLDLYEYIFNNQERISFEEWVPLHIILL